MPTDLTLLRIKSITIEPVRTIVPNEPCDAFFSFQRIVFHFHDGSRSEMSIHLDAGMHALALGDIVTHDKVTHDKVSE